MYFINIINVMCIHTYVCWTNAYIRIYFISGYANVYNTYVCTYVYMYYTVVMKLSEKAQSMWLAEETISPWDSGRLCMHTLLMTNTTTHSQTLTNADVPIDVESASMKLPSVNKKIPKACIIHIRTFIVCIFIYDIHTQNRCWIHMVQVFSSVKMGIQ